MCALHANLLIFMIISCSILVRMRKFSPEGMRPLGRPRPRWEDNIKMDLREVGWGMDWIDLALDRDRWLLL